MFPLMSALKSGLIGAGAVGGVIAILFASGTITIQGGGDDATEENQDSDEVADASASGSKKRRRKKRRKRRGRGRRGGDLESLGYIGAVEISEQDRGKVGTTVHDKSRAHQGLSLYNPCAWGRKFRRAAGGKVLREARLIDNQGEVLHAWSTDFVPDRKRGWSIAKLSSDGYLYVVNARSGFAKLDWDSKTMWGLESAYHHDFNFGPDGNVYALMEHGRDVVHKGQKFAVLDNGIAVITPEGVVKEEIWFYDIFKEMPEFVEHVDGRLQRKPPKGGLAHDEDEDELDPETDGRVLFGRDVFHANTVNFATSTIEGVWNEGDIITSIREMHMVVVLDKKTHEPKWKWGPGDLQKQHDPEQLGNGNLLVFDNGNKRHWSRVLEIDPRRDNEIVWEYKDDDFYSNIRGLSQRLPNGHTFIVSSQRGRAFEVTPEGETVWEYWSPDVLRKKLRVPFRMTRLEGEALAFARKQLDEGKGNPDGAQRSAVVGTPSRQNAGSHNAGSEDATGDDGAAATGEPASDEPKKDAPAKPSTDEPGPVEPKGPPAEDPKKSAADPESAGADTPASDEGQPAAQ